MVQWGLVLGEFRRYDSAILIISTQIQPDQDGWICIDPDALYQNPDDVPATVPGRSPTNGHQQHQTVPEPEPQPFPFPVHSIPTVAHVAAAEPAVSEAETEVAASSEVLDQCWTNQTKAIIRAAARESKAQVKQSQGSE